MLYLYTLPSVVIVILLLWWCKTKVKTGIEMNQMGIGAKVGNAIGNARLWLADSLWKWSGLSDGYLWWVVLAYVLYMSALGITISIPRFTFNEKFSISTEASAPLQTFLPYPIHPPIQHIIRYEFKLGTVMCELVRYPIFLNHNALHNIPHLNETELN